MNKHELLEHARECCRQLAKLDFALALARIGSSEGFEVCSSI